MLQAVVLLCGRGFQILVRSCCVRMLGLMSLTRAPAVYIRFLCLQPPPVPLPGTWQPKCLSIRTVLYKVRCSPALAILGTRDLADQSAAAACGARCAIPKGRPAASKCGWRDGLPQITGCCESKACIRIVTCAAPYCMITIAYLGVELNELCGFQDGPKDSSNRP